MSGYTVTITPSDGQPGSRTIIKVDTANGTPRISEFTVQADGDGLSARELPAIDLAGLVAALSPSAISAPAPAATAPPADPATRQPRKAARGTRRTAKPAKKSASTRTTATLTTATRRRRRGAAAEEGSVPTATAKRQYRRMPPQDDVVAAWKTTHSPTGLAEHFDVPRHTATGWLRRLRSSGAISAAS